MKASSAGAHGPLLPATLYDTIGHVSGSSGVIAVGGDAETLYGDLRVVAVRLDPCFAALAPDPHGVGCKNQLRLIMQELKTTTGKVAAFDSALHLFYSLTREELLDIARSIADLRRAAAGDQRLGALAPHPLMKQQGPAGAMAAGVRALILQHAGQDNLARVTKMSGLNDGFNWKFEGFDVVRTTPVEVKPMVIPTLPDSATAQVFFRGFANDVIDGSFTPATMGPDDLTVLADATRAAKSRAEVDSAFAALVRIDHPAKSSPDTTDCASCHLAAPLAVLVALPKFSLEERKDASAYVPRDGASFSAAELASTFDSVALLDLHAFSYLGSNPSINQRTVNETAAIVEYLNGL